MTSALDMEHRRQRMQALLDHKDFAGNKAMLGRALGLSSGAYVRQIIAGERPITEKLVAKIEAISGGRYRGWFGMRDSPKEALAAWPLRRLTPDQWQRIDPLDWAIAEDAALTKLQALVAERAAKEAAREDEAPRFARPAASPRKRTGTGG